MNKYYYKVTKRPERLPAHFLKEMDIQFAVCKRENVCHSFELYSEDFGVFLEESNNNHPSNIILTGFSQEHIDMILPYIKNTVKSLCLFKCPRLESFDFIRECENLTYIDIYWNQKATALWNVKDNENLHTLIIDSCKKLSDFSGLKYSSVSHLEIWGCNYLSSFTPKTRINDLSIFQTMSNLEILRLAIAKNEDIEKDLSDLSKLTKLKEFDIKNRYFSNEQLARLKASLPKTVFD